MLELFVMYKKTIISFFFSLLFLILAVETYVNWKNPVPPSNFIRKALFFDYKPNYLSALYYVNLAEKESPQYWAMRALQEVERAIIKQPTMGILWLWDAKLRKFLGMRYMDFVKMAIWIDPYRIDAKQVIDQVAVEDFIKDKALLDKIITLNRSFRFEIYVFKKIWNDEKGKKFLLTWEPTSDFGKAYLAWFLARNGELSRALELSRKVSSKSLLSYPLSAITRYATKLIKEGNYKKAENLLLQEQKLYPTFDNVAVILYKLYLKENQTDKADQLARYYLLNYQGYIVTEKLKKISGGLK